MHVASERPTASGQTSKKAVWRLQKEKIPRSQIAIALSNTALRRASPITSDNLRLERRAVF